jgi:predicted ATPase
VITELSLENFKAFEKETFAFGRLNVLTGLNSSGKSSVIQAVRLIHEQKPLDGLGPLQEYVRSDCGGLSVQCAMHDKSILEFSYAKGEECPQCGIPLPGIVSYISADRFGPKNSLPLHIDGYIQTVGARGENIVDFLSRLDGDWDVLRVPPVLVAKEGVGIKENIKEWLRTLSPGVDFHYEVYPHTDTGRTEFDKHRPVHVGFGLSYTLPIIAGVLVHAGQLAVNRETPILLLLENPEAHLHPSGQTKMGELLSLAASCGIQVIVETHSDHLVNGIRIAVKEGKLSPDDVKFYFFKSDNSSDAASVETISIDRYGMMDHWPEGFFDETEKNLMRLI